MPRVSAQTLRAALRKLPNPNNDGGGVIHIKVPNEFTSGPPSEPLPAPVLVTFTKSQFVDGSRRWLDWTLGVS